MWHGSIPRDGCPAEYGCGKWHAVLSNYKADVYESWQLCLYPVYTIQPVVKPVVQPLWQPAVSCKQTSNRLSNRLSNWFDNHVKWTATVRSTGCQTELYNQSDNWLYTRYSRLSNRLSNGFDNPLNVCIHDTTGSQTGLTTGCIV